MSDDLFLLNKPISRKMYTRNVSIFVLGFIMLELLGKFFTLKYSKDNYNVLMACLISFQVTLMIFLNIMLFIFSYKRFKDIGLSGFLGVFAGIIFLQIPAVIILMCLKGKNVHKAKKSVAIDKDLDIRFKLLMIDDATITLCQEDGNGYISREINE